MNQTEILQVLEASGAGLLRFPEVVGRMLGAGVESYFVDYLAGKTRVYGVAGEVLDVDGVVASIAEFREAGIVDAIRRAQRDEVRYPEFARLAQEAGVAAYWAFLTGRRVVYLGRDGQMHVEPFPR